MNNLKRLHYSTGVVLSRDDFLTEQSYHREKLRRHNRVVHGSGIVHGLSISIGGSAARPTVTVSPGAGIDAAGNELELEAAVSLAITLKVRAFVVVVALQERLVDPVPRFDSDSASDEVAYSRVEELCEASVVPDDPPQTARLVGLVLGRFVRGRGGWRRDPGFKRPKLRR